jgi:signal transduction histidine kinase/HPt (histidine-containing phosphotransfer) domain-containing protein
MKGKVLLGFLLSCMALAASWFSSKVAFRDMLYTVEDLSTPNDKLWLLNKIFKEILQLDQLQKSQTDPDRRFREDLAKQSEELLISLDSLRSFYEGNELQVSRIDSMKRIVVARDLIFEKYLRVKSGLVNNQALAQQVDSISGLIVLTKPKKDSAIVTTKKRTVTTTVYQNAPVETKEEPKRGLLNRLFGGKKKEELEKVEVQPQIVEKEEIHIEVDTLQVAKNDSLPQTVTRAVKEMEVGQRIRTKQFVSKEQELILAGNALIGQLLKIMEDVEVDVVRQVAEDAVQARGVVAKSADRIEWIMIGFVILAAAMAYLTFSDISKSNQYRRELEEARDEAQYHSMAKQRFLSNMSHEIRTPLQSIIGYSEMIKKQDNPRKEDLNTLHNSSLHLLHLVNEVLDYSRIVSDSITFEKQPFAIASLLEEVLRIVRPEIVKKRLELVWETDFTRDDYLIGDAFRLRQIVHNLLSNAVKFTGEGRISLHALKKSVGSRVELDLRVTDTGIGIEPDKIYRIFNEFEQADGSISRRFGGTGLGLTIVKALVEGQGGSVHVESVLGEGSCFSVSLSFDTTTKDASQQAEEFVFPGFGGKVWLVDDDLFILQWCSSAEEVLDQPWDTEVTVVLTDIRMSGMHGDELCRRLRKQAGASVRFYAVTAQVLPEEQEELLKSGFDGLLVKPFRTDELLKLLASGEPLGAQEELPSTTTASSTDDKPEFDFSYFTSMTMGDEVLLLKILQRFVTDSRKDLAQLEESVLPQDNEKVSDLLHRMAGRIGQVGARKLGGRFREAELAIRKQSRKLEYEELRTLVNDARLLVDQIEEKVTHLI